MVKISEIEQIFNEIFQDEDEGTVKSVATLYESDDESLKLIIAIQGLSLDDVSVIHTKFIFRVNEGKTETLDDSFSYLYDINCIYHQVQFDSIFDMKKKIEDIIQSNDFGDDLIILSDFIEAPAMFLNYYMRKNNITDYSIFEVIYEPKFKNTPCSETTFDFDINVNNNYDINLSIEKIMGNKEENESDYYKFQFKFMDDIETVETNTISNIHFFIGENISKLLNKKLRNKL